MLGIRDWDEAPRRGHAAGEASRRDRCGIKKTCRGRVFLMALVTDKSTEAFSVSTECS